MKIVCKYKEGYADSVTFHVTVDEINKDWFTGTYYTTIGKSKKTSFKSENNGMWHWANVKIVKIEA